MGMGNTFGLMEAYIKVISNMELGMAMAFGKIDKNLRFFQVATEWIRSRDLEFINGQKNNHIKANSKMILGKDTDSCINILMGMKNIKN